LTASRLQCKTGWYVKARKRTDQSVNKLKQGRSSRAALFFGRTCRKKRSRAAGSEGGVTAKQEQGGMSNYQLTIINYQ
jgi:hypothetical protein